MVSSEEIQQQVLSLAERVAKLEELATADKQPEKPPEIEVKAGQVWQWGELADTGMMDFSYVIVNRYAYLLGFLEDQDKCALIVGGYAKEISDIRVSSKVDVESFLTRHNAKLIAESIDELCQK